MSENVYFSDEKNLQYVIKITFLFSIIGTFTNVLFNFINQQTATASEIGLGIAGAGSIFSILFTMLYLSNKNSNLTPKNILNLIIKLLPTILTFIMISLYFSLNAIYSDTINSGNVASEYTNYSTISAILLFIQTLLVGSGLYNLIDPPTIEESMNKKTNKILMVIILFILNLYLYGISSVILKYFSTDG